MSALVNTVAIILGVDVLVGLVLYFTVRRHWQSIRDVIAYVLRRRRHRRAEVDAAVRRHPAGRAR